MFAHVDAWVPGGVALINAYFYTTEGLSERNWAILGAIGIFTHSLGIPWILAADFNMSPDVIAASGWLESVAGSLVFPQDVTCHAKGAGSIIDYFVVSSNIKPLVKSIRTKKATTNKVHDPVVLTMTGDYAEHYKMVQTMPRAFPRDRPSGPIQCSDQGRWADLGSYIPIGVHAHANSRWAKIKGRWTKVVDGSSRGLDFVDDMSSLPSPMGSDINQGTRSNLIVCL